MSTESDNAIAMPPFDGEGEFLKAALHTHSTVSDGALEPRAMIEKHAELGYDVVATTDHRKLNDIAALADVGPMIISGMELHPPAPQCGDSYHMVAIDIHEETDHSLYRANDLANWANERGAVVFTAHPYWCGRAVEDLMLIEGSIGVEVYNHGCEVEIGRGISRVQWDEYLDRKGPTYGISVDDGHAPSHIGGGWVMIAPREKTVAGIKEALREGRFYSVKCMDGPLDGTAGPRIHSVTVSPAEPVKEKPARKITVKCSPAERVVFYGPRWRGGVVSSARAEGGDGEPITEASHIWTDARYVRVEVQDGKGGVAWTNALFGVPGSPSEWRLK